MKKHHYKIVQEIGISVISLDKNDYTLCRDLSRIKLKDINDFANIVYVIKTFKPSFKVIARFSANLVDIHGNICFASVADTDTAAIDNLWHIIPNTYIPLIVQKK